MKYISNFKAPSLLFAVMLFYTFSQGQTENIEPCGVTAEEQFENTWLSEYQQNPDLYKGLRNSNDILYLPLTIHLVGRSDGTGYFSDDNLFRELCELNEQFKPTNIQFFIQGDIKYHANTNWFNHATRQVGNAMYTATRVAGTINCYIDNFASGACGYATIGGDRVFLRISCVGVNSTTWAHELGHSLTLNHTFVGWENTTYEANTVAPNFVGSRAVERMDRSNCTFAGDGFCDTEPDYLSNRWSCNSSGESTVQQLDPDSTAFRSKARYFMSYSNDACMSVFSEEQVAAMRTHIQTVKANMVVFDDPFQNNLSAPFTELILPEFNEVITADTILFTWNRIENAESYRFQLSRFQSMGILIQDFDIQDTFLYISSLELNRNYFWRVKPNSSVDFCQSFTPIGRFRYEEELQTSIREIDGAKFTIYPSIISSNQALTIDVKATKTLATDMSIVDITGKEILKQKLNIQPGIFREQINLPAMVPGMYFVRFTSGGQMATTKFAVQ